jgi:hypothetical protein
MPTAIPVTAEFMNYGSVVFFAFFVISTVWYFVWGKKNYQGPPTHEVAEFQARRASIGGKHGKDDIVAGSSPHAL